MTRSLDDLRRTLSRIDGRGYKAYKDLQGTYRFGWFDLSIDHVQGDPFASPSRLSARAAREVLGIPEHLVANRVRRIALGDYLTRSFAAACRRIAKGSRGTGHSGLIAIDEPGQEVLERTSVLASETTCEVRFVLGLPAAGRRVLAREAAAMLLEEVPQILQAALKWESLQPDRVQRHVFTVEDQEAMRRQLRERGLVAFVANGALLPRRSGVDDRPMIPAQGVEPVLFQSPPELEVTLDRPNGGPVTGMGIPAGVTLIVGGGYHGKSTLLCALERGVYNHIPGDGREGVVTTAGAMKIRAEDGRYIEKVDISPFIDHLPLPVDTRRFSTENASGSTSQAANIMEAVEAGADLLLLDEDTSATNFIIRDARMQALVHKDREPITPFIDRVRELYEKFGVSTIMVMGGSGDYFDVADHVIMMDAYRPREVTRQAREVAQAFPTKRRVECETPLTAPQPRHPTAASFDASRGRREVKIDVKGLATIVFGRHTIDLSAVEQLVDPSQTRAIGQALVLLAAQCGRGGPAVGELLRRLEEQLDRSGLDVLVPYKVGNLARPRMLEVAAALNRLRTLRVR